MRTTALGAALLAATLALAPHTIARAQAAQPRGAAKGKARSQASLEEVAIMLAANDEDEVRTALETAATLPPREVLPLIEERVRSGLPLVLLEVALDTLLLLNEPSSAPLLAELARHRRPTIRVRALDALAHLKSASAEQMATRALGDGDPNVRKAAADALGAIGAKSSFPALTRAFELGIDGASTALGRVASSADVAKLVEYIGTYPPDVLTPMFKALLARREIAEAEKQRVVAAFAALNTDEARAELAALLSALPRDASAQLRRALTQAAQPGVNP